MEFGSCRVRARRRKKDVCGREGEIHGRPNSSINFLGNLNKSVRGKAKQYNRMISVLWHCYLISDSGTQLEVAEMLGVSDSLVSDYRKRIESNLQQLSFNGVNEARQFEKALRSTVREIIEVEKEEEVGA
jgi:hypothetical protein